eukprot:NODE_335_length_1771_cov_246.310685_g271_i0.p1 GENE.NODE_335_length_1771_cov_246.310685_g271_i0~~NODE_335_length_1771_cov_246.310685_g271_i0.p1  ORF type:complete len:517 (+),score=87.75 NODE_335_length_1771_cov_246.310685_g271_i0:55-1605(+)
MKLSFCHIFIFLSCVFFVCECITDERKLDLDEIVDSNTSRRNRGRLASAFIYLFVAFGMCALSSLLAVLLGWIWQPFTRFFPTADQQRATKLNTGLWVVVALLLSFIISGAGGMPGWMIIGFLYVTGCVCISVVTCITHNTSKSSIKVMPSEDPAELRGANADPPTQSWQEHPRPLGRWQLQLVVLCCGLMALFLVISFIIIYGWKVPDYKLWDYKAQRQTVEISPQLTTKVVQLLYSWGSLATDLRLQLYVNLFTSHCGSGFTKQLKDDDEKRREIKEAWIDKYAIDMSIYIPTDYRAYPTVNDWFIRTINSTYRLPDVEKQGFQILSPADCRMLVYSNIEESEVWVKGRHWSLENLLEDDALASTFQGGHVAIARLAPSDYHRFVSSVEGTVISKTILDGTYWSVSSDAVTSHNDAFHNVRSILIIQTKRMGKVAYIAIGATCVGSVVVHPDPETNNIVRETQELGYMQFGGSTIILLFEPNRVVFEQELLETSKFPVESYVLVNTRIGWASGT